MTADHALALITGVLQVTMWVTGPILLASLVGGVVVGVVQTATQINEQSIGYVVKVAAVIAVLLTVGPAMAERALGYARTSIGSIETVVR